MEKLSKFKKNLRMLVSVKENGILEEKNNRNWYKNTKDYWEVNFYSSLNFINNSTIKRCKKWKK